MTPFGLYNFSEIVGDLIIEAHIVKGPQTLSSTLEYIEKHTPVFRAQSVRSKRNRIVGEWYNKLIEEKKLLLVQKLEEGIKTDINPDIEYNSDLSGFHYEIHASGIPLISRFLRRNSTSYH
jgi:hypothetical protein